MFTVKLSPYEALRYYGSTLIIGAAEAACIVVIIAMIVLVEYSLFNSIVYLLLSLSCSLLRIRKYERHSPYLF
jgi:hypothetical protein